MPVSSECQQLFPAKVVSRLVKWTAITYEDYLVGVEGKELTSSPHSQHLVPVLGSLALSTLLRSAPWVLLPLQELSYTKDIVEAGLAEDTHLYYMALIERGTGRCLPAFSIASE